jgi:nucleoid-associated protein EbfC
MAEEPSMMQMLKQARGLQKQMKQIQKKVDKREVSAMVANGKIEVVCTGKLEIRRILIDPSLLESPDKRVLQDQLVLGVNTAIKKAQNLMAVEMQKMAGDMGIPQDEMAGALGEGDDDDTPGGGDDAAAGGRLRRWFGR